MFQTKFYTENNSLQNLVEKDERRDLHVDELIEGTVVAIEGTSLFIDLPGYGTGIIFGREFMNAKDMIKNIAIGDTIKGKITELENEEGYIELSLREARAALMWKEADQMMKEKTQLSLEVKSANKGGLMIMWHTIEGFLPASQLSTEHYPEVDGGDKEAILKELRNLVGQVLNVTIININPKEGKLIFSEKGGSSETKQEMAKKYDVGEEVEGTVTGAVDFGLFVKLEQGLEGLVHISEIDWSLVEDPKALYKVGDEVKAKIIEIKDGKVSLSIKALKPNPWQVAKNKYEIGTEVEGVVIKFNKHGAVVAIEEGISGLVHISDFESEEQLRQSLELGKSYTFKITIFDADNQKMALTYTKK
ncbi:S1 RNA-binding domain-containing protein [Candidatus Nomurabacteria bacterium]|nr:S1 RNA-binding domain-containing protein [Candidatus Nomurabacteria bacterium]